VDPNVVEDMLVKKEHLEIPESDLIVLDAASHFSD
jgi:hypothetical protein